MESSKQRLRGGCWSGSARARAVAAALLACAVLPIAAHPASAFELFTARRASFHLLENGGLGAVACVPVVVFSAPFIILRNTVDGRRIEHWPIPFVMIATIIAGLWSLICGRVLLDVIMRVVAG